MHFDRQEEVMLGNIGSIPNDSGTKMLHAIDKSLVKQLVISRRTLFAKRIALLWIWHVRECGLRLGTAACASLLDEALKPGKNPSPVTRCGVNDAIQEPSS